MTKEDRSEYKCLVERLQNAVKNRTTAEHAVTTATAEEVMARNRLDQFVEKLTAPVAVTITPPPVLELPNGS